MTTVFVIGGLLWVLGCVVLVYAVLRIGGMHDERSDEECRPDQAPPIRDRSTTPEVGCGDVDAAGAKDSRRSA